MWVFDATPLIYLAKVEHLRLASTLAGNCYIPEQIHSEVVSTDLEEGYPDARRIEQCIDDGYFEVISLPESTLATRLQEHPKLSAADIAVLACADSRDTVAVMDERLGRTVAAVEGIETRGTAYLVLRAVKSGTLTVSEARNIIDSLVEEGWYCSPAMYTKIVQKLESLHSE